MVAKDTADIADYYCREDDGRYAYDVVWFDPHGNQYTPGSNSEDNPRIVAVDSKLSVHDIVRLDTGMYRCQRNSDSSEFDEAMLEVEGMYYYYWCKFIRDS